ncbi:MAG: protoheme IX farnesyltransferase [Planctomycetes bacterium]|nr:protoheme IX farnesyltransferase [Planctomycetota bacterium]
MKADAATLPEPAVLAASRLADYLALTKPRVAILVLFTVGAGVLLAAGRGVDLLLLFHTVFGTALVAGGASALNQLLERNSDALMRRTENRPLPAGRLQPREVWVFGAGLGLLGVAYLAVALHQAVTPLVATFTFAAYVGIYTPLKSRTSLNTLVGAVPGALPPVIGWTAVRGSIDPQAWALFAVVFLWQVPHFLAIAWIYRDDYARAGLCMLPVADRDGAATGRHMVVYALALVPASFAPVLQGSAGPVYLLGALALGLGFLGSAAGFARCPSVARARRVLRASLVYLPGLLGLLLLDSLSGVRTFVNP